MMMNALLILTLLTVLAAAAAVLYRLLSPEPEAIPELFDALLHYVEQAVRAVEQHARLGEIPPEARKETALTLVQAFAQTDGHILDQQEIAAAAELIEAACSKAP